MSITPFFVDAFTSALDRGIASEADLLRHLTPDVLSVHLPRTLWARLLTACLGAPRVDAAMIVETLGIPNLCEHMPKPLLWTCLAEMAATALGGAALAPPAAFGSAAIPAATATPAASESVPTRRSSSDVLLPPPPATAPRPGSQPAPVVEPVADAVSEATRSRLASRAPSRGLASRLPTAGASTRRPQAVAAAPTAGAPQPSGPLGRAPTPAPLFHPAPRSDELDFEIETDIRSDWKDREPIPVDDEQLVDWSSSEETVSGAASIDRPKR